MIFWRDQRPETSVGMGGQAADGARHMASYSPSNHGGQLRRPGNRRVRQRHKPKAWPVHACYHDSTRQTVRKSEDGRVVVMQGRCGVLAKPASIRAHGGHEASVQASKAAF